MLNFVSKFVLATAIWVQFGNTGYAQEALPQPEILVDDFKYLEGAKAWPPELQGIEDVKILPPDKIVPSAVTELFSRRAQEVASQSDTVQRLLGERFAAMGTSIPDNGKEELRGSLEQQSTEVTFYSYSRNVAVAVLIQNGEVTSTREIEGYQPPETQEEIDVATKLALGDPRLSAVAEGYQARGLITDMTEGQISAGNRVIYVSFEKSGTAVADFFALVDLTTNTVIDAGPTAGNK
jgi:hypothetical protein